MKWRRDHAVYEAQVQPADGETTAEKVKMKIVPLYARKPLTMELRPQFD